MSPLTECIRPVNIVPMKHTARQTRRTRSAFGLQNHDLLAEIRFVGAGSHQATTSSLHEEHDHIGNDEDLDDHSMRNDEAIVGHSITERRGESAQKYVVERKEKTRL